MVTSTSINGAWAVVLTSTNDYVKGVFAIKHALHNLYQSRYPLLVLYTSAVIPQVVDKLKTLGCIVKEIEPIRPKGKVNYHFERFSETWTKLSAWDQTEYDRLVLLDADMLPLQNMDELMQMDFPSKDSIAACHACLCNPQKIKHYPASWVPENCSYTGTRSIEPHPVDTKSNYFNSGLIVLVPNVNRFKDMLTYLHGKPDLNNYPFPDQDFLNEIFADNWVPLSFIYNALKTLQWAHTPMWDISKVKNIHYILTKPWDVNTEGELSDLETIYKPLYQIWWDNYNLINDATSSIE
ncbi:nucleotide-diphospho-sugar transferase [Helicostylum pulchrum]|uniref:Uncharacterized protein n=1 Tax=Helicostylum pulchrum TaxID=562976 RepID=A0ABP9XVM9_9FUNG|nr:nucleotide-diphospho-sugar transferase [Helicostylum pulchrum]